MSPFPVAPILAFAAPTALPTTAHPVARGPTFCPARPTPVRPAHADRRRGARVVRPSFVGAPSMTLDAEEAADDSAAETAEAVETSEPESAAEPAGAAQEKEDDSGPRGILMLCLGNICRSPAAEAVMNRILAERNLSSQFFVDSCGTGGGSPDWYLENGFSHHEGNPPDTRMTYAAGQRGIDMDTASRPLTKEDFDRFHMIVAMDASNVEAVETARAHWGVEDAKAQVSLLSDYSKDDDFRGKGVPDPYWSGQNGFDKALDLIQEACEGLADKLVAA